MEEGEELADDYLVLHEDIQEENDEGVKEILGDFQEDGMNVEDLCSREVRLVECDPPEWGMSAVHRAAAVGSTSILGLLLHAEPHLDLNLRIKHNGLVPLHLATAEGQTAMVSYLAANGADIDAQDKYGRAPIHLVAERDHRDIAQILGVKGVRVNMQDIKGQTPLHAACRRGNGKIITFLLKKDAEIDHQDEVGQTGLHKALLGGHIECIDTLLSHGAKVNMSDQLGNTPLHLATDALNTKHAKRPSVGCLKNGKQDDKVTVEVRKLIIDRLLDAGAQVNTKNNDGNTPLHLAVTANQPDVVKVLLERETNVNSQNALGMSPLFYTTNSLIMAQLLEYGADTKLTDNSGNVALHIFSGSYEAPCELLRDLFKHGVNVDARNNDGMTPLFFACQCGDEEKAKFLLQSGAKPDIKDCHQRNVLHIAVTYQRERVIRELIDEWGMDVNCKDSKGQTPLHVTVEVENLDLAKLLIDRDADLNIKDNGGMTAACAAIKKSEFSILSALVENGAIIDNDARGEELPLNVFAKCNDVENVTRLLDQGIDLNRQDKTGRTALHDAIAAKAWFVVKLLLNKNANAATSDKDKETPLHHAARLSSEATLYKALIIKNGAQVDALNSAGETALHICVRNKRSGDILAILVNNGANCCLADSSKRTPLHDLVQICDSQIDCLTKMACLVQDQFGKCFDTRDSQGKTVLYLAAEKGYKEVVNFLVQRDAGVNVSDSKGMLPLHIACHLPSSEIASVLIDYGSKYDALDKEGKSALCHAIEAVSMENVDLLLGHGAENGLVGKDAQLPIHIALENNVADIIELLLMSEVDVNARDREERTALHLAAAKCSSSILNAILDMNADVQAVDNKGNTPLHYSTKNQDVSVMRDLLSRGSYVNTQNKYGDTALHLSSTRGSYSHIDILLSQGAEKELINSKGERAIHLAARSKETDALELLIANETQINTIDKCGQSPLLVALSNGNDEGASILLDYGANTRTVDHDGQTALHKVARLGSPRKSIVQTLVKKGLSLEMKDRFGRTPLDLACGEEMVQILSSIKQDR